MVAVSEVFNTWQEGFANKDSSRLSEFFTDDFRFVSTIRDIGKQEALDWTAAGGNQTSIDNLEVLYENDEVSVIYHSANAPNNEGIVMALATKRDGKFSHWRVVRQAV